jgi:hypothetical protein
MGVPKLPKSGLLQLWSLITLCASPQSKWGLKQSCNPCRELSKAMWHATWTQGNRVYSKLLVVGSQIANLTPDLSFGHNLCFRCPNGWCELILDIYVSIAFQWYKEFFEPLGFDPCNHSLNIRESTRTPTPNMGVHLGMWGFILSHSFAFPGHENTILRLGLGSHPCKPFALVVNPRLGSWHACCQLLINNFALEGLLLTTFNLWISMVNVHRRFEGLSFTNGYFKQWHY